jgi:hypothetical protein
MRDTTAIGVILATRREVHPFGEKRHLTIATGARSFSASYVATSTDFTALLSAPARHHFMRGNRVGPEEDALAVVNG